MRNYISIFIAILLLFSTLLGQESLVEMPSNMQRVAISDDASRVVKDFYFNSASDSTAYIINSGTIDFSIYPLMVSASQDSLVLEAYGIILKRYKKPTYGSDTVIAHYIDSTRIATIRVDSVLHTYILEDLFDDLYLLDGVRIVHKTNGVDADSVHAFENCRALKLWEY